MRLILASLLVWLGTPDVPAQVDLVRTYTEQDGLHNSDVSDVAQGPDGRMWFLTPTGISIYDGTAWETSDLARGGPLRAGFRFRLDDRGGGWAVDAFGAVHVLDEDGWTRRSESFLGGPWPRISCFAVASRDGRQVPLIGTLGLGLFAVEGPDPTRVTAADGRRPGDDVRALLAVGDVVLVGTDAGLLSWRDGRLERRFTPPDGLSPGVWGLADDPSAAGDSIWVQGRDWVGRLGEHGFSLVARGIGSPALDGWGTLTLVPDGEGGLFFGNAGGLFNLAAGSERPEPLGRQHGLVGGGVRAFHRDREGNLWIATAVGVSKVVAGPFDNLAERDGLYEDEVTAILETSPGNLLLGHNRGLTFYRDGVLRAVPLSRGDVDNPMVSRVLDMERDAAGNVWLAVSGFGLGRLDTQGRIRWFGGGEDSRSWVYSARFDAEGRLWASGHHAVWRYEDGRLEPAAPEEYFETGARRMFLGADGTLYLATGGWGLVLHRGGSWRRALSPDGLMGNNVYAVLEDSRGRVLVGTQGGLRRLEGDSLVRSGLGSLAIERPVYFIIEDRQQRIWLGTSYGVFRWDGDADLRHFTMRDGLAGLETNRAAGIVDAAGRVWLGTDRGVSRYDEVERTGAALEVELLEVGSRGDSLPSRPDGTLGAERGELTFLLRAISFVDETQIEFRTRLEGLDRDWVIAESSTRLEARYPRVPPGSYTFVAQARNARGSWGRATRSPEIVIAPPFWRRGWFLGLAGAAIVLLGLMTHNLLAQRRYARRLEDEVRRRTSDLERSRRSVVSEKERLAVVLGSIADGVIALDHGNRIVLINSAAARITGLDEDEAVGRTIDEALQAGAAIETWRDLLDAVRGPGALRREERTVTLLGREGGTRQVELAAAPYRPPEVPAPGLVLVLRDVTERRRIEGELAKTRRLESLGVLAGGIAHDFNNLLTAILGNVSLVQSTPDLDDRTQGRLREAEKALGRAHRLARQLVTFARGGAPVTGPASIGDLLRESASFVFSGAAVGFALELPDDLWPVEVDADQIHQVFENLFFNARQAMDGRGRVEIVGRNLDAGAEDVPGLPRDREFLRIDVRDFGRGIRPEDLERIFEPYYTTKDFGSGLGLATSFSIVQRHGGTIRVASVPARGTTFSVYLPASTGRVRRAPERESVASGQSGRVLVLEDETFVADVLREMLGHLGYEVAVASNGDELLDLCTRELARERHFDVAILDLTVPGGKGGAEVLPQLLTLDPELKAIASSGYSDSPVMSRYTEYGFTAVLPKPYTLAGVGQALRSARGPLTPTRTGST